MNNVTLQDLKNDKLVRDVIEAWTNKGPRPMFHKSAIYRLKQQWPTLHDAIVELVDKYESIGARLNENEKSEGS